MPNLLVRLLRKLKTRPPEEKPTKNIFDQIREKHMAEFIMREANSGKYDGKQPIFIEQNITRSPVVRARLDQMVADLKLKNPDKPIVIVEMQEDPEFLLQAFGNANSKPDLTAIYDGGDSEIDSEGELARRQLRNLAERVSALDKLKTTLNPVEYSRIRLEIQAQLAALRRDHADVIVHNEPEKWLRTAANDADFLLQYLISKNAFQYFGLFIYSDLEPSLVNYITNNWEALDKLSGPDTLIFAFEERGHFADRQAIFKHHLIASEEKIGHEKGGSAITLTEKEERGLKQQRLMEHIFSRNDSLTVAGRLGIPRVDIPCLVLWRDMDDKDLICYPFKDKWVSTGEFTEHLKKLFDIVAQAGNDAGDLKSIEKRLAQLKVTKFIQRNVSAESIVTVLTSLVPW